MKNNLISSMVVGLLLALTLTTGVLAVRKLVNNQTPSKTSLNSQCIIIIKSQKYNVTELRKTHSGGDVFVCDTDMTDVYVKQHENDLARMTKYLVNDATPTKSLLTPSVSPTQKITQNSIGKCIVTINGKLYDVTRLRQTHSGGDVFTCGTDMTNTFIGRHGSNWGLISNYLISTTGAITPMPTNSRISVGREDDD